MNAIPPGFTVKQAKKFLEQENRNWPTSVLVPISTDPKQGSMIAAFRSSKFLVQVFQEQPNAIRLSVNRTMINSVGDWQDGIGWDELQAIKKQLGYGDWYGVEVYPRDRDIVNVANIRHLWLMQEPLQIGWFAK